MSRPHLDLGLDLVFPPGIVAAVRLTGPMALALASCVVAAGRAEDLADLEMARNAYDAGEYELAAGRFEELVLREPPPSIAIRVEALQFLGASLLFLGDTDRGRAAFEQLLILEPRWEIPAFIFPTAIMDEFTRVKGEMAERLAALDAAAQAEREEEIADYRRRREALADALAVRYLARSDEERRLYLAFVPFGVGQFQNGDDLKGWIFFGAETTLAAANVWTFWAWHWYTTERAANADSQRGRDAAAFADGYKIASWTILGTLAAVVVAGIIDALVGYEEPRTVWSVIGRDDVPEEHRLPEHAPDEFLVPPEGVDPATLGFRLRLRF